MRTKIESSEQDTGAPAAAEANRRAESFNEGIHGTAASERERRSGEKGGIGSELGGGGAITQWGERIGGVAVAAELARCPLMVCRDPRRQEQRRGLGFGYEWHVGMMWRGRGPRGLDRRRHADGFGVVWGVPKAASASAKFGFLKLIVFGLST